MLPNPWSPDYETYMHIWSNDLEWYRESPLRMFWFRDLLSLCAMNALHYSLMDQWEREHG